MMFIFELLGKSSTTQILRFKFVFGFTYITLQHTKIRSPTFRYEVLCFSVLFNLSKFLHKDMSTGECFGINHLTVSSLQITLNSIKCFLHCCFLNSFRLSIHITLFLNIYFYINLIQKWQKNIKCLGVGFIFHMI